METILRSRAARRALALIAGSAIAFVLVEGASRVVLAFSGTPFDAELTARRIEDANRRIQGVEFVQEPTGNVVNEHGMTLHPYLGYQIQNIAEKRDDNRPYWQSPEAAANFDVLVLGGSVAADFIGHWKEDFLPLLLADPQFAERKVMLHWRACPGHKQPQHALNLLWALSLGDRPDLVLLLDGFNDLAVSASNAEVGVHPLFPMFTEMEAGFTGSTWSTREYELIGGMVGLRRRARDLAERAQRYGLARSAVLGRIVELEFRGLASRADRALAEWTALRAAAEATRPKLIDGPHFAQDQAAVRELALEAWVQSARTMDAACRARGIAFLHVLQPAARDLGSKPLSEEEDARSREPAVWREAIEQGYPRLREAGALLAKEGADFLDASGVFKDHPETLYRDACHFEQPGYALLAQLIADHLRKLRRRPRLESDNTVPEQFLSDSGQNCAASVEPSSAVVEHWPFDTACVTASK